MSIENSFTGSKPAFERDKITPINIQAHIDEARKYATTHEPLQTLQWFKNKVTNNGIWDYKQQNRNYVDFGNWHYGVIAKAIGIPESLVLSALSGTQNNHESKETAQILSAFKAYNDNYGDNTNLQFNNFSKNFRDFFDSIKENQNRNALTINSQLNDLQAMRFYQFLLNYKQALDDDMIFTNEQFMRYQTQLLKKIGDDEFISQKAREEIAKLSTEDLNLTAVMNLEPTLSKYVDNSAVLSTFSALLSQEQIRKSNEFSHELNLKNNEQAVKNYNDEIKNQERIREQERIQEQIKQDQEDFQKQKDYVKSKLSDIGTIFIKATMLLSISSPASAFQAMPLLKGKISDLENALDFANDFKALNPIMEALESLEKDVLSFANFQKVSSDFAQNSSQTLTNKPEE